MSLSPAVGAGRTVTATRSKPTVWAARGLLGGSERDALIGPTDLLAPPPDLSTDRRAANSAILPGASLMAEASPLSSSYSNPSNTVWSLIGFASSGTSASSCNPASVSLQQSAILQMGPPYGADFHLHPKQV